MVTSSPRVVPDAAVVADPVLSSSAADAEDVPGLVGVKAVIDRCQGGRIDRSSSL